MTFFYPLRNKYAFEIFDKAYKEKEIKTVHVWSPQGFIRVQPATGLSRMWARGDSNSGPPPCEGDVITD